VFSFSSEADAAFYTITPQDSILVTSVVETVTFDLDLTSEITDDPLTYIAFDFDFTYDSNELTFDSATYGRGMEEFIHNDDGAGNLRLVGEVPFGESALPANPGNTYDIASISFTIVGVEVFDGLADFELVSQTETQENRGLFESQFDPPIRLGGAQGGDIGAPVPLPGALWFLGSALIGLVGFRRKTKK
jgi:hypothetical protein